MDLLNAIQEISRTGLFYVYAPEVIKEGVFYLNAYMSICAVGTILIFSSFATVDIAWNRTTVSNVFAGLKEGWNFVISGGDKAYYLMIGALTLLSPAFGFLFAGWVFLFGLNYQCT